ncbi:MAG TPA: OmpH family outer membrane protein [Leeuwenhoekiella sp.]|nr:OmpH family outer membrane protein [Leeuwenhoekiella sp.]
MKQMKTLVLAIALMLGMNGIAQAQDSKIAHIATQELLEQMPAFKSAQAEMQKIQSSYEAEMQNMGQELQKTMERYSREAETKTDEENLQRQQEVETTRNKIVEYRQTAMQDMQKKESDLLKPVYEKARTAIQKVARDKGYNYVLDSTTGTGLLLADGYDLMDDVKKSLGI